MDGDVRHMTEKVSDGPRRETAATLLKNRIAYHEREAKALTALLAAAETWKPGSIEEETFWHLLINQRAPGLF